jgi:hypothetical protein
MKKIILIILILALIGGGYYLFFRDTEEELSMEEELLDYQVSFSRDNDLYFSNLLPAEFIEVDLDSEFDSSLPGMGFESFGDMGDITIPEFSISEPTFNISSPSIGSSIPQMPSSGSSSGEEVPTGWTPNATDCAGFSMAPSCSYVPAANRDMCEACQEAGF